MAQANSSEPPILHGEMGGGEPLLLVHGLMATGEIFGPILDAFARRHTVIVPDKGARDTPRALLLRVDRAPHAPQ